MPNDNRRTAGTRVGRTHAIVLEARVARWSPSGDPRLTYTTHAWAEGDGVAMVPGPLVRARVGDTLRVTLRNPTARQLAVGGFGPDSVRIPAGTSRTLVVPLERAGTSWYGAHTSAPDDPPARTSPFPVGHYPRDETLLGGLIVDEANTPAAVTARERVLLIHIGGLDSAARAVLARAAARGVHVPDVNVYANGTSWPNSERMRFAVGDTVHWRIINASFIPHPLHLHGFYFRVDGTGDGQRDSVYAPRDRRMAVTELVPSFATTRLTWVPEREGNWLFHCHYVRHMAPLPVAPRAVADGRLLLAADSVAGQLVGNEPANDTTHAHDESMHAMRHMAGIVYGITVVPRAGAAPTTRRADSGRGTARARALSLWVTGRDATPQAAAGVGYVLQEGAAAPAADSVRRPGTPLRLVQGQPVAITVHNTRRVPMAVHWHGMELESQYDGVGSWSGRPGAVTPAIAPGDSFVVRFTPPRAGTFIYHTHDETGNELALGLYGALVVEPRGSARAPSPEPLLVFGAGNTPGPRGTPPVPYINGDTSGTVTLSRTRPTRLRLINITENDIREVRLVDASGALLSWRLVGKDGWTPPDDQRTRVRTAAVRFGVGETYDLEIDPAIAARAAAVLVDTDYYPQWKRMRTHTARLPVVLTP